MHKSFKEWNNEAKESGLSEEAKYLIFEDWQEERNKNIEMFRTVSGMLKILSRDLINVDINMNTIKALIDKLERDTNG